MAKKVSKPRLVKDYLKLPKEVQAAIKLEYPNGYSHKLINYTTPKGEKVLALPFDTEEFAYLVRVSISDSRVIVREDDEDDDKSPALRGGGDDLNLEDLDVEGLKEQDDVSVDDDDDDDESEHYIKSRRRKKGDDEDDMEDEY